VASGILLLSIYSLGFSVPMLLAGYASQVFRQRIRKIGAFPYLINLVSGLVLVTLGLFIIFKGMVGFGF
jgi:cytochrome c-type biogenesis protein